MKTKEHFFRCHLHCDKSAINNGEDCEGQLITRKSIYGAIQRSCRLSWENVLGQDFSGWPEILKIEDLDSVPVNHLYED